MQPVRGWMVPSQASASIGLYAFTPSRGRHCRHYRLRLTAARRLPGLRHRKVTCLPMMTWFNATVFRICVTVCFTIFLTRLLAPNHNITSNLLYIASISTMEDLSP
ncbi:hypothetical protein FA10DRAFT_71979 [Acaromyces ingoldii]|uniref:Uncharacterized protein n=1 Tax=Acaromyces ingoldii TaxID=215250 RepID=A0A316YUC8_9BASI|nr:hypothetical protein FA10DRAFT_71979 [Acaromyces ingoldii]PWN91633.1 hypothetical protein FA10DRAFT_71979 [Acaromyces ingoldii]